MSVAIDVPCELSDGTVLRANVYSPVESEPVPVLLLRHPYSKDDPFSMGYLSIERLVRAGYIVVVQDVRGRYRSDGVFQPSVNEEKDGREVVQWAATLPGSNGLVGTWGASYAAETQWTAALGAPPALRSMATMHSPAHSSFDGFHLRGGALELGSMLGWAHGAIAMEEARRASWTPDAVLAAHDDVQRLLDSGAAYDIRPLRDFPPTEPFVLDAIAMYADRFDAPALVASKTAGHYDSIPLPAFLIGGWYDVFLGSTLAQYRGMLASARANGSPEPHLLVGPWSHGESGDRLGDLEFGASASAQSPDNDLDLTGQHIRWFDATLKGETTALADVSPVRIFVMGSNAWLNLEQFPPAPGAVQDWYLSAGAALEPAAPTESVVEYDYDPANPVPTLGGANLIPAPYGPGPIDQSPLYERADVVSFRSEPLAADLTVIGSVAAVLFASSSTVDTDFVVRLCDEYPDGRCIVIVDGIVRASARFIDPDTGRGELVPLAPGEIVEYHLDLWSTATTFLAGHRLRVDVTSSSSPRWDANLNTGRRAFDSAGSVIARQRIHTGADHPSRITLPVVDLALLRLRRREVF